MCKRFALLAIICGSACLPCAYPICAAAEVVGIDAQVPNGDPADQAALDGVTVEAHREKLSKLRVQIKKSVDDFYDAFNKANTEPEYETHCSDVKATATYISEHICTPRLMDTANEQETQGYFGGYWTVPAFQLIALRMRSYKKRLHELIHDDPNVRQAALRFDALTEQYAATSREKVRTN